MKIAIDANVLTFEPSGVAKSLLHLFNACKKIDNSLEIICFSQKEIKYDFAFSNKKLLYKKFPFNIPDITFKNSIADCDFIHYHWNGQIIKYIDRKNSIMMLHDVLPLEIPNYFKNNNQREKYIKKTQKDIDIARFILTPSQYSKEQIIKNFQVDKEIIVLHHGVTLPENINLRERADKNSYLIYVGGYDSRKGLVPLLKAYIHGVKNGVINKNFVLVGKPNYFSEEFKQLVSEAKSMGVLKETGYVDENELANLIFNANALVYPSKYEGFGLPPLEAMKLGCPVVTTKYTSIPEICEDACLYSDFEDVNDFIYTLKKLEDNDIKNSLVEKGRIQAEKFSWEKTAEKYLDILNKYINNIYEGVTLRGFFIVFLRKIIQNFFLSCEEKIYV